MEELGQGKQHIDAVFQELFPDWSANEDVYDVTALTKAYHKYKREYLRQLVFAPEQENLSKYTTRCFIMVK